LGQQVPERVIALQSVIGWWCTHYTVGAVIALPFSGWLMELYGQRPKVSQLIPPFLSFGSGVFRSGVGRAARRAVTQPLALQDENTRVTSVSSELASNFRLISCRR
jgi:hypothetical protein